MPALGKQRRVAGLQVGRVDGALLGGGEDAHDAPEGGRAAEEREEVEREADTRKVGDRQGVV